MIIVVLHFTALPLLVVMTIVMMAIFPQSESFSDTGKAQIRAGLDTGKAMGELMEKEEFTKSLKNIGKSIGAYLGVLGPFMSVILGFIPGSESKELQFMKKMMKQIDTRFDRVDSRFDDIKRFVEWNPIRTVFGGIEQDILSMSNKYQLLYGAPPEATASRKEDFLSAYKTDYHNSGYKLYRAIVSGGVFEIPLGDSVMRYTKYDCKKTQMFLLGIMHAAYFTSC